MYKRPKEVLEKQYAGYRLEKDTRFERRARTNTEKLIDIQALNNTPEVKINLTGYSDELLGKRMSYTAEAGVIHKKAKIVEVYPKCVTCKYRAGENNDGPEVKVSFSIADLVQQGVITFKYGVLEVVNSE